MAERTCWAALLLALAQLPAGPAQAQAAPRAAWLAGGAPPPATLRILRAGKEAPYQDAAGLQACDQLELLDRRQVLRVVLADGARLRLDADQPRASIACQAAGVSATLARLLAAWNGKADTRVLQAAAMSRGEAVTPLAIPILLAPQAVAAAGAGQLHLRWRGGVAPFRLALRDAGGGELAARAGIAGQDAALALPPLAPGRYALVLRGADGDELTEDQLLLVAPQAIPAMPAALGEAALTAQAQTLFYADFLIAHEDGRYALHALQLVAALAPQSEASAAWLAAWGQPR